MWNVCKFTCGCHYLPVNDACIPKSPVELQRLPKPAACWGRGDGDGAGEMELLLGESECIEPFDWWMDFVRLCVKPLTLFTVTLWRRDRPSGVLLDARAVGLRNFQSADVVLLVNVDGVELLCVGLCEVTIMYTM